MAQYRSNKYQLAHLFTQENIKTLKVQLHYVQCGQL